MDGLFKVKAIVQNIAFSLDTRDYLSLRSVNKTVRSGHLDEVFDKKYWQNKLRLLKIEPQSTEDETIQLEVVEGVVKVVGKSVDCLNVFDEIKKYEANTCELYYRLFHQLFDVYCQKLSNGVLSNFFPIEYEQDPMSQAVVIKSIHLYKSCLIGEHDKLEQQFLILQEFFVNSVLQELELSFKNGEYDSAGNFVKILLKLDEDVIVTNFFESTYDLENDITFPNEIFHEVEGDSMCVFDSALFENKMNALQNFVNEKLSIIDKLFGDFFPQSNEFIEKVVEKVVECLNSLVDTDNFRLIYFPKIYGKLIEKIVDGLNSTINGSPNFKNFVKDYIGVCFASKISLYIEVAPKHLEGDIISMIEKNTKDVKEREKLMSDNIFESLKGDTGEDNETGYEKHNFLASFGKVFKLNSVKEEKANSKEKLEMECNLKIVSGKLENIKGLVNIDLCVSCFELSKEYIDNIKIFEELGSFDEGISRQVDNIFQICVEILGDKHIKPGFETAIELLKDESLEKVDDENQTVLKPLVQFTELINIGDIFIQMVNIFYKKELAQRDKHGNTVKMGGIFEGAIGRQRSLERMVDDFVAEGLNIGIKELIKKVEATLSGEEIYNCEAVVEIKTTEKAIRVVELLNRHCFLLNGATEKGTIDVYQQEIGERFFREIASFIKRNTISTEGAIYLICDLNYYYDFVTYKLKQKNIVPLFAGLKQVGQLYIISGKDSKDLGKMLSEFHGIFTQEEIYEFVQRRSDWLKVKRDVEKAMYGLDCKFM